MLTIWNRLLPNLFSSDSFLMIFFDILIQSCFFVVYYCGANDLVIRPFKAKGYSYFFLHIDQYFFITRDVARIRLLSVVTEFERPNQVNYYRNWIESENSVQEAGERAAWEAVLEASGKRYWKRAGSDTGSEQTTGFWYTTGCSICRWNRCYCQPSEIVFLLIFTLSEVYFMTRGKEKKDCVIVSSSV